MTDLTKVGAKSGRSPSWTGLPLLGLIRVLYQYYHRMYGIDIFTYMNGWIFMVNVGKYIPYMDGMG